MSEPDVAPLLPHYGIPEDLQSSNYANRRYAAGQFHAASTGINSSLT